jgi:hypothetical protein
MNRTASMMSPAEIQSQKLCNALPPKEIYDVLHFAESKGMELPKSVGKWFQVETVLNES